MLSCQPATELLLGEINYKVLRYLGILGSGLFVLLEFQKKTIALNWQEKERSPILKVVTLLIKV